MEAYSPWDRVAALGTLLRQGLEVAERNHRMGRALGDIYFNPQTSQIREINLREAEVWPKVVWP